MNRSNWSAIAPPNAEDPVAKLKLPPLVDRVREIIDSETARLQRKGALDATDARALRDHVNSLRVLAEIASILGTAASKAPPNPGAAMAELMADWEEQEATGQGD